MRRRFREKQSVSSLHERLQSQPESEIDRRRLGLAALVGAGYDSETSVTWTRVRKRPDDGYSTAEDATVLLMVPAARIETALTGTVQRLPLGSTFSADPCGTFIKPKS
jgi:hypothetical protein